MKLLVVIIAFLISSGIIKGGPNVLSLQSEVTPTPTTDAVPTKKIVLSITPTPTKVVNTNVDDWQYPGSVKTGNNKYESREAASKITDWYVSKIKSMGLPVTSFVKTSANEKIKNSLAAARNNLNIKIEITQNDKSAPVTIVINVDNP